MYLVFSQNVGGCEEDAILGICGSMIEVTGIIWAFSRFNDIEYNKNFENCPNIIYIASLDQSQYDQLLSLRIKYRYEYLRYESKNYKEWYFNNTEDNIDFWYAIFRSEEDDCLFFSKEDCDMIENIIENSKILE